MNRQETQIIKGVSILLMLFLHLFNRMNYVDLTTPFLFIGDVPFVHILTRAANPVAFFLILGGYGLFSVYKKEGGDKNRYKRAFKLLIHYWVILIIFVSIGHYIKPISYPGNWIKVLFNVTTFDTTYNGEWWFLFPYICLSVTAPFLFRFFSRWSVKYVIVATFLINLVTSFCISRYGAMYLYGNMCIYNPLLYFHLLFPFMLGAMASRVDFFSKSRCFLRKKGLSVSIIPILMLILLVIFRCLFETSAFHSIYAFLFITLFLLIRRPKFMDKVFANLGDHSMNMWLIHSWFCYYLFSEFIYGFKYPLVIFVVLLLISYFCSLVINFIAKPIVDRMLRDR